MNEQIQLVAFDLDGTLLRGDSVCEVLARHLGHLDRMSEFEKLREQEEIKHARKELVGYYTSKTNEELSSILANVAFAPGVFEAFDLLKEKNIKIAIISITFEFAVEVIARKLGVDYFVGTRFDERSNITHFWPEDKGIWLENLTKTLNLDINHVAAVGDSWGDVFMLERTPYSYFVGQHKPEKLTNTKHVPDGNIYTIVQDILKVESSKVT